MMYYNPEIFVEESDHPFQKLFIALTCLYLACKFNELRESQPEFDDFQLLSRRSKSFHKLLHIYGIEAEDFAWEDGWYQMLEANILNELNFRFMKTTP